MQSFLLLALFLPACGDQFRDGDGDGYVSAQDCDDTEPTVFPDATELINGRDDDCDGVPDDGTAVVDDDGDGFAEVDGDCNDDDDHVYPGAPEEPDGVDQSCDGEIDEGTDLVDDDRDGFTEDAGDCDDANVRVYPGASEDCADGLDNDCNGGIDDRDADGDGFVAEACGGDDCEDDDAEANPDAAERGGDLFDNDCNGSVDEDWIGDTIVSPDAGIAPGADDLNGYDPDASYIAACNADSAYSAYAPYPTGTALPVTIVRVASSTGSGAATDADLTEGIETLDGYFAALGIQFTVRETIEISDDTYTSLTQAEGNTLRSLYADEAESSILVVVTRTLEGSSTGTITGWALNPLSSSQYMALDQDFLDGYTWAHEMGHYFGLPHTFEGTSDGDDPELADGSNCSEAGDVVCDTPADPGPSWYATSGCAYNSSTCEATCGTDANGDTYAPDVENVMSYYHCGDQHFSTIQAQQMLCVIDGLLDTLPIGQDDDDDGYVSSVDCDDADPTVNPAATEVCDGIDNDCDERVDVDAADERTWYEDADGDDYGVTSVTTAACDEPPGYAFSADDCDDADDEVYPGAPTSCVGYDQDCDGHPEDEDADGDGYIGCDECDDTDASISPAAPEPFDGVDNDCSGYVDDDPSQWPSGCSLDYYGDSAYAICVSPDYTWAEASAACAAYGYHLVVVNDSLESVFLEAWAAVESHGGSFWIGLNDRAAEGAYVWEADDSAPTYPIDSAAAAATAFSGWPWTTSEPNNYEGGEDCVELDDDRSMEWNDEACGDAQNWICEAGDGR